MAPNYPIPDGIEACRSLFSKIWIDEEKCSDLIKALENYRQEYDSKKKVYLPRPLHDWSSHYADAYRYLAVSLSKTSDSLSAEELEAKYQEAQYGSNYKLPEFFRDNNTKGVY